MKIDRSKLKKYLPEPVRIEIKEMFVYLFVYFFFVLLRIRQPADCKLFIDKLKSCDRNELHDLLKPITIWHIGKVSQNFYWKKKDLFFSPTSDFLHLRIDLIHLCNYLFVFFSVNYIIGLMHQIYSIQSQKKLVLKQEHGCSIATKQKIQRFIPR